MRARAAKQSRFSEIASPLSSSQWQITLCVCIKLIWGRSPQKPAAWNQLLEAAADAKNRDPLSF